MKKSELRKLIREEIQKLNEESITKYLSKPSDPAKDIPIMMVLERTVDAKTAYYRLETDKWFRRYMSIGKGSGIMIRRFKVSGSGKNDGKRTQYPVLITYLPNEFDSPDDDNKSNYEKVKGFLVLKNDEFNNPKDVEKFVNSNIKFYLPF